ncbi:hypothetical protein E8E12_011532 [Didymella heteroderae]|uniref:GH16 domain-containing protein n=1 Tax=Didymella heteroderae TaxID=1769908 RepID=A0A9P4X178_9PLEO|nr:hypothetical protein E8E12_011532 [Didymella heteroderae]
MSASTVDMRTALIPITALATTLPALAAAQLSDTYHLSEDLSYTNFFPAFTFFSGPDPTQGFVQYQNAASAIRKNLIGYLTDTQSVLLGVDHTSQDPAGRASVRLESRKGWNAGLLVADIRHMPASTCGVWPAYWLVGSDAALDGNITWPDAGEIDILEGVNEDATNSVTLHTSRGCVVDNATSAGVGAGSDSMAMPFSGHLKTADCDVAAPHQAQNAGCSIAAPALAAPLHTRSLATALPSYGTSFNAAGGGIYALQLTPESISVWLLPRSSPQYAALFPTPASSSSSTLLNTSLSVSALGVPIARFAGPACDVARKFRNLKIVFDTSFCGSWAGGEWGAGGCARKTGVATCEAYVRDHPEAFVDAYWEIAGLKWFQKEDENKSAQEKVLPLVKGQGWFGW